MRISMCIIARAGGCGRFMVCYTGAGIPAVPMYIVFSAGVLKGQRPGAGNMLVDYVRVWQ